MRTLLLGCLLLIQSLSAFTQGTVIFLNRSGTLNAPIFDVDGTTGLSGSAYSAQLYAGPTTDALQVVPGVATFRTEAIAAGYLAGGTSSTRTLPGIPAGGAAYVQVRVWETAKGPTYDAAVAAGGKHGQSTVFRVATGGGLTPPTALHGLASFKLQTTSPPSISVQPSPVSTGLGGSVRFEVTATGSEPLTYQWLKDGRAVAGGTGRVLQISSAQASDAGSYVVRVTNAFGSRESTPVALTLIPAPTISQVTVSPNPPQVGRALRLEVFVTGTGPFTYQWRLNGSDLPGATTAAIERPSAAPGTYAVRVTGPGGSVTRDVTTVTARYTLTLTDGDGGSVTASPGAAEYDSGTVVTLTATAAAGYVFSGWAGDLSGTQNPATITMNDHRQVEALFRPTGGSVYFSNRNLGLGLNAPILDTDGTTRLAGDAYLVQLYAGPTAESLVAIASPEPFRSGDGAGYFSGGIRIIPTVSPGATAVTQVRAWAAAAGATYEAAVAANGKRGESGLVTVVTGNAGSPPSLPNYLVGLTSFQLQLTSLPKIVTPPIPLAVRLGATAQFTVVATGTPPLTYQWRRDGKDLAGATSDILEISPVSEFELGNYSVRVSNALGFTESAPVRLSILVSPRVTKVLVSPDPPEFGRPLRLEVTAEGDGPLAYQWYLSGTAIEGAISPVFETASAAAGGYSVRIDGRGGRTFPAIAIVQGEFILTLVQGEGGRATAEPAQSTFREGSSVTLTATADPGYVFHAWSGDLTGTANPVTLTMDQHRRIEPLFRPTAGSVYFVNRNLAQGLDAPLFDVDGTTRLAGSAFLVQLYAGPRADALAPIGAPEGFRSGDGAGYFVGGIRIIPTVEPGRVAQVQVRAWEAAGGATYEAAAAAGARHGSSAVLAVTTGNVGSPPSLPPYLTGLRSFSLRRSSAPSITRDPVPVAVPLGKPARFEVVVTGTEPLFFQWRRNGLDLDGAHGRVLELPAVSVADVGDYRVWITNAFGQALSAPASLTLLQPPSVADVRITPNPPVLGQPLRLEVVAGGDGPLTAQWFLNGSALTGADALTLERSSAAAGVYSLRLTGPGGTLDRDIVTVHAEYALELTASDGGRVTATPAGRTYPVGTVVTVEATADPGYVFAAWTGDLSGSANPATVVLDATKRVEAAFRPVAGTVYLANRFLAIGLDAPILDEDGVTRLTGGQYAVQLYGGAPGTELQPVGNLAGLRTGAGAGYLTNEIRAIPNVPPGTPARVQLRVWDRTSGATYEAAAAAGGKHGASLVVTVTTGNAGSPPSFPAYLSGLQAFKVARGTPPQITTPPESLAVAAGAPATFGVVATGTPTLRYQWLRNGSELPGATTPTFSIAAVTDSDVARYRVRVSNDLGSVLSPEVTLSLLVPPTVQFLNPPVTVQPGGVADLALAITGSRPLVIAWYEGARGDTSKPVGTGGLTFRSAPLEASTTFWARVSNAAGSVDSIAYAVTVVRLPQVITFAPPTAVVFGSGPVTLSASADSALPVAFELVSGPATLAGNVVTPTGPGTVVLKAVQPGDTRYQPATPVQRELVVQPAYSDLTGAVFVDGNGDGLRGASETGLGGISIQVLALDSTTELALGVSGADGTFTFNDLPLGSYFVRQLQPAGYVSTTPNLHLVSLGLGAPGTAWFGEQPAGTLRGRVYVDLDGDGREASAEPGLPGVTLRLAGDSGVLTRVTDGAGLFSFVDLPPGIYQLEELDPVGFTSTSPNLRTLTLAPGDDLVVGFGDHANGTVRGVVFADVDGDGTRGTSEAGLPGVVLRLTGPSGQQTLTTDRQGAYQFDGRDPGSYQIEAGIPVGYFGTTAQRRTVTLLSGGVAGADFGAQPAGTVAGVVFDDANGSGTRDAGEAGIGGVQLRLLGAFGQFTTTSGDDGAYSFTNVEPGNYTIEEIDPPGYSSTTPNLRTLAVLGGGSAQASFGDQAAGSVAGAVFADVNGNGTQEPGESGISGVVIRLSGADGQRSQLTDSAGGYRFTGIVPGTYQVEEIDPIGYVSTTPNLRAISLTSGGAAGASFGDQPVETISGVVFEDLNGNSQVDPGEPGIGGVELVLLQSPEETVVRDTRTGPSGQFVFSDVPAGSYVVRQRIPDLYTVLSTPGSPALPGRHAESAPEFVSKPVRLEDGGAAAVNFGNNLSGQISGTVFNDLDGDGTPSPGEAGLGGVTIDVRHAQTGALIKTAMTSGSGGFQFTGLAAAGYQLTPRAVAGYAVTPASTTVTLGVNGAAVANFAATAKGTVSGRVFNDEDGDGQYDPGEPGLGGVQVRLTPASGAARQQLTAGDGSYLFTGVTAGPLTVNVTAPDAFEPTTPATASATLAADDAIGLEFGLQNPDLQPPTITADPADRSASPGDAVEFTAIAEGTGPLLYQWLLDGQPVVGATNPVLRLSNVTTADAGGYQLRVRNGIGTAFSRAARLTVATADPYTTWVATQGLAPAQQGSQADPDGDGLPNVLEFVLGTSAGTANPNSGPATVVTTRGGAAVLALEFARSPASAGYRLVLQASEDLRSWQDVAAEVRIMPGTTPTRVQVVDSQPIEDRPYRFLRLGVGALVSTAAPADLHVIRGSPLAGSVQLSLSGQAGATYRIEWSTDLVRWTALGTVTASDAPVLIEDSGASGQPYRMYRAVTP